MSAVQQTRTPRVPAKAVPVPVVGVGDSRPAARVRLGALNNLRWLAVIGQSIALLFVRFILNFTFPLALASSVVGASAVLNVILMAFFPASKRLSVREATAFLAYDTTQLATLLFLTGGIENPFALMFVGPVVISAATLDVKSTLFLGTLTFIAIVLLATNHVPLPWVTENSLQLPPLYQFGIVISLILGIGFASVYAYRIAEEAMRMSAALAATQLALAREHRVAALGGLAAAAAHELGTPLGTIAVVARELEHELAASPHAEDFRLLRTETDRCRAILTRLAQPEDSVVGLVERLPLGALLDDLAAPHRGGGVGIVIDVQAGNPPKVWRLPEILHGLGNLLENAAEFAVQEVRVRARWDDKQILVEVLDDGVGFSNEILELIGEPYVTSRPRPRVANPGERASHGKQEGMGLGFFIAKTLIEQTGGTLGAGNRSEGGAIISARWPRGAVDGEVAPRGEFQL